MNIDEQKAGLGANLESALYYPDTPSNFSPWLLKTISVDCIYWLPIVNWKVQK